VDLEVAAGSTVAVVGSTGAGKSTLAGLLVRLVDPTSGRVLLDGVDLRDLREGALAQVAALVPQSTFVFDDTVRGNIALGLDDPGVPDGRRVDDAAIWEALRLAQAEGFVAALPDGLDTAVGERGSSLSGGQRQRLALARALVRRPRLLVLDDATSALDPAVERAVLDGLRAAGRGTTVVVVAYRPATIALADEVVHLDRGRVVDRGPADEVAARDEGYRELVTAYARASADREAARGAA
jgi:ABC-type multidrug transport system fused ATPase/permease subunit